MQKSGVKFISLSLSYLLFYNTYSYANIIVEKNEPIDNKNLTAYEIESEILKNNRLKPNYSLKEEKRLITVWKKYVPPYVKFMKVVEQNIPSIALNRKSSPLKDPLPSSLILPIDNNPLNQESYPTCTTFSLLGAIGQNISFGYYDNINFSPSCTLQMETTANGSPSNIWSDGYPEKLISFINQYGLIDSQTGDSGFCNSNYPNYDSIGINNSGLSISLNNYYSKSFHINPNQDNVYDPIITYTSGPFHNPQDTLNNIKENLNHAEIYSKTSQATVWSLNYYTVIGFSVNFNDIYEETVNGKQYPTFINTTNTEIYGGHNIYVFGYDDNICISTPTGQQCGILYLRNSWGNYGGANGIFLMTYDYFNNYYFPNNQIVGITYLNTIMKSKINKATIYN